MTKSALIELSKKYPLQERYVVDDLVKKSGKDIRILFLPPAHCELNPIELVWAFVKGKIATLNTTGGPKNVLNVTLECLKLVTKELWTSCIKDAIKFEEKFWQRDRLIDKNMDEELQSNPNLIINIRDESSDESDIDSDVE